VTWHVEVDPFTVVKVHGAPVNVPVLSEDQLTVPVGVVAVPVSMSVTVTVHVAFEPTKKKPPLAGSGAQLTVVRVMRGVANRVLVPLLAR
jgi:hypothetical protein